MFTRIISGLKKKNCQRGRRTCKVSWQLTEVDGKGLKGIHSFLKKLKFLVWKIKIRTRKNLDLDLDEELQSWDIWQSK